jgi:protein SCO1/2
LRTFGAGDGQVNITVAGLRSLLAMLLLAALPASATDLPGDSVYQLSVALVDQRGQSFHLHERAGKAQLVTMFYTSCQYVCPMIIDTLRKTQTALTPQERHRLDVLLISFDPQRDTPARLQQVFRKRKLDAASWTLARAEPADVRKMAALLDIQYRALANGDVNHSSTISLLDGSGRIIAQTHTIGAVDADFVAAIQRTLGAE